MNVTLRTMGKIRRGRQMYHITKAKSMNDISNFGTESRDANGPNKSSPTFSFSSNVFEGIDIQMNFNQSLREEDARSIVTTKSSFKDPKLTKVERRTVRREAFMRKLGVIETLRTESKERKKRQQTAVTGDMRPLADALPSLEEITTSVKSVASGSKAPRKQRALPKSKQRQKSLLADISAFRKVLSDPCYRTDPTGAISNYIQEKIQQEIMDHNM